MRARFGGGLVFLALAAGSVVACTLIVDGETKDLTGTCTPTGANDNACGKCALAHCQTVINASCAAEDISGLEDCIQNPSPVNDWACNGLLGDAAVHQAGIKQEQADLRSCLAGSCMTACQTCTLVKAGPGKCGECIMDPVTGCGALLNIMDGCCDNSAVQDGVAACTASVNPNCTEFRTKAAAGIPDGGSHSCNEFSDIDFAKCVVDHCDQQCPQ